MSADDIKPVLTDEQIVAAMRGVDKAWNGLTDDEIIANYGNEARVIERAAILADRASREPSPQGDAAGLLAQHHRDSTELRRLCAERDQARQTAEYWKAQHLAGNVTIQRLEGALQWVSATLQAACRMPEPIREAGQITLDGDTRTVSAILDLADAALDLEVRQ